MRTCTMGIHVELLDNAGHVRRHLPDPTGGDFDSAGDFDRLLHATAGGSVFDLLDEDDDVTLESDQMDELIAGIAELISEGVQPAERRGLMRLRAMAQACARDGGSLQSIAD
jgi:hypothetical protein